MTQADRPTEITLLAAQLDTTLEFFWERLNGLTDEEYLWEPGPGAWNLRPREQQRTGRGRGAGGWVCEFEPRDPQPAPLRTIAWLMWHLSEMCLGRADWTNGEHRIRDEQERRGDLRIDHRGGERKKDQRCAEAREAARGRRDECGREQEGEPRH